MVKQTGEELTDLQIAFCREYARDLNAGQAYIRAGYKPKSLAIASSNASRLLKNDKIRAYLGEIASFNEALVISEVIKIAFANITDVLEVETGVVNIQDSDRWSDRAKAAVESITVTESFKEDGSSTIRTQIKMRDKLSALEKLMKKLRLYPSNQGVLDAVQALASQDLLIPGQAETIAHGLEAITEGLRSLTQSESKESD